MGRPLLHAFEAAEEMYAAAELAVLQAMMDALESRAVCHLALAGGNTPQPLYERLALRPNAADWSSIQLWWGDERCVAPDHADSNFRLVETTGLTALIAAPEHIHRIRGELGAREAAADYGRALHDALGESPVLDVVLLGVGEDGHTASLFPRLLPESPVEPVLALTDAPKPPAERVSLSENVLRAARQRIFLAGGPAKRSILDGMTAGADTPAARVAGASPSSIYYYN